MPQTPPIKSYPKLDETKKEMEEFYKKIKQQNEQKKQQKFLKSLPYKDD